MRERVLARYRDLPRAARWGVLAAAGLLAYFGIIEPALDATARLRARADQIEAGLRRERDLLGGAGEAGRAVALAVEHFGLPSHPGPRASRERDLRRRVDEILQSRGVRALSITPSLVPLSRSGAPGAGPGVQRLVLEVRFESSPEDLAAIVRELELSPEVTAVGRVQAARADRDGGRSGPAGDRVLRATVSPEVWVLDGQGAIP